MATGGLGNLTVTLGLDAAEFTRGLTRAEAQTKKFQESLASLGTRAGTILGAGLAAAATGMLALAKFSIDTARALDDLDEAAQAVGLSAVALAEFRRAASESGVSAEKFDTAITKLNVKLTDAAAGGKESQAAFKALGIEVRNSSGQLKTTEEVLAEVANKFQGYKDGAEKSALAVELFGRAGAAMIPFLNQGADGLRKYAGISQETVEAAKKLQAQIDTLKNAVQDFGLTIASKVIPFISKMIEELIAAHRAAGGLIGTLALLAKQSAETLADPGKKLGEVTAELNEQKRIREEINAGTRRTSLAELQDNASRIKALEQEKKFLQELQRNRALANAGTNYSNEGRQALGIAPIVPKPGKEAKADIDEVTKAYEQYVQQLTRGLEKEQELSEVQKLTLALQQGNLAKLTDGRKAALMFYAQQIDAQDAWNKKIAENARLQNEANKEREEFQNLVADVTGATRDKQDLERLKALDYALKIDLISLKKFKEEQDRIAGFDKELKKSSDAAEELGLTFTSALEDAIVDFTSLREVINGLGDDILRLTTRKLVTEPLLNDLTDSLRASAAVAAALAGLASSHRSLAAVIACKAYSPAAIRSCNAMAWPTCTAARLSCRRTRIATADGVARPLSTSASPHRTAMSAVRRNPR